MVHVPQRAEEGGLPIDAEGILELRVAGGEREESRRRDLSVVSDEHHASAVAHARTVSGRSWGALLTVLKDDAAEMGRLCRRDDDPWDLGPHGEPFEELLGLLGRDGRKNGPSADADEEEEAPSVCTEGANE